MSYRNERSLLNHLIELCRDEEQTLRFAANRVKDPSTKAMLDALANERSQFAADLLPHAQRLGGADAGRATLAGSVNRWWMSARDRVMGHTDRAMVAKAKHADDRVVADYVSALEDMLPPTVRDLVERQLAAMRARHEQMRTAPVH